MKTCSSSGSGDVREDTAREVKGSTAGPGKNVNGKNDKNLQTNLNRLNNNARNNNKKSTKKKNTTNSS